MRCLNVVTWLGEKDAREAGKKIGLRPRWCGECKGWHLTNSSPHSRAKRKKR